MEGFDIDNPNQDQNKLKFSTILNIVRILLLAGILLILLFKDFTITTSPTINNTFSPSNPVTASFNTTLNNTFNITTPNITVTPTNMTIIGQNISITLVNQTFNYTCINNTNETMCWK